MLEKITITPSHLNTIDLGFFAEALIFYGKVRVVASSNMLNQMVNSVGPDLLIEFINLGVLELSYLETQLGTAHNLGQNYKINDFIIISSPNHTLEKVINRLFIEKIGRQGRGRRLSRKIVPKMSITRFDNSINEDVLDYFSDKRYITQAAQIIVQQDAPNYTLPYPFEFTLNKDPRQGMHIHTNIDFRKIQALHPNKKSDLTPLLIVSRIYNTKGFLYFSAKADSEIASDSINYQIVKNKFESLAKKANLGSQEIELFQNLTLNNTHAIREAVNSGAIGFADIFKLTEKAERFKIWVKDKPTESMLIHEYYNETVKNSWVTKLPAKSTRFALFTGGGLLIDSLGGGGAATAAGIGLSVIDTFIVDKLIKGWKPNQFVDTTLKPLLDRSKKR